MSSPSLLRTHAAVLAALAIAGSAGCAGEGPVDASGPVESARTPLGLASKPLRATPRGDAIADELVVAAAPGAGVAELARDAGGELVWRAPLTGAAVLRFDSAAAAAGALADLRADDRVAEVTANVIANGTGIGTSPHALDALQWNLSAIGLEGGAPQAGAGVRVALLDSGVAYEDHADGRGTYAVAPGLADARIVPGHDFVNGDEHPNDDFGHGTHLASLIASQQRLAPVAGGVELMPVKVLDDDGLGTELALAEGIAYAVDEGAQVINLSVSFSPAYFPSRHLQRAIDYATSRGVVLVAAAGNHGASVVTYPAAFRDVIAAGGSSMRPGRRLGQSWRDAERRLEPAPYSNRGFLVDVLAPGGRLDRDANRDGIPDAIVAESFTGDPTDIEPILYAGTSQAAAHVTGAVAAMVAEDPDIRPFEVRAILGDTARGPNRWGLGFDPDTGRGHARADAAARAASLPRRDRPRYFAGVHVAVDEGRARGRATPRRSGRAEVEIVGDDGEPAAGVIVYGTFTGSAHAARAAVTGVDGVARFRSPPLSAGGHVLAFQVEAVADPRGQSFDRPRGIVRTDTCSLELLSEFAGDGGLGDSGIGTSPHVAPIAIDSPETSPREVDTVTLLNFSWSMATVPMAVAVEEAWLRQELGDARTITSHGSGIGTSPHVFDRSSFPVRMQPASGEPDACTDILVTTFAIGGSGIGTSPHGDVDATGIGTSPHFVPIAPAPGRCAGASCRGHAAALAELWLASTQGIGTSPHWTGRHGLSRRAYGHLDEMVSAYADFGAGRASSPVAGYVDVLTAAGLGLSPPADADPEGTGHQRLP